MLSKTPTSREMIGQALHKAWRWPQQPVVAWEALTDAERDVYCGQGEIVTRAYLASSLPAERLEAARVEGENALAETDALPQVEDGKLLWPNDERITISAFGLDAYLEAVVSSLAPDPEGLRARVKELETENAALQEAQGKSLHEWLYVEYGLKTLLEEAGVCLRDGRQVAPSVLIVIARMMRGMSRPRERHPSLSSVVAPTAPPEEA